MTMWRLTLISAALVTATLLLASTRPAPAGAEEPATVRVGVYDSRAVAVAYAASDFNPVSEKMKQYDAAKEAGDTKRMEEYEAWGQKHQRQLHRQGFGRVPVTDLLEHVADRLPDVARETGVDVIAFECNYRGPHVEEVDVTRELVMLFDPSGKTLETVAEMAKVEPVDLDEIEQHHDH
jgi:hypothetical protein